MQSIYQSSPVGNSWGNGSRLLWQLPWVLLRKHRTCFYCINQVTVFQGQYSIFGNMNTKICTQSREIEESVARESNSWLSVTYELGHGKQWGLPQTFAGKPPISLIYPNPTRAYSLSSTSWLAFHCLSHRLIPLAQWKLTLSTWNLISKIPEVNTWQWSRS